MDRQLDITLKEYLDMQHAELMREVRLTQTKQDATNGRLLTAEKDIIRLQERANTANLSGMGGLGAGIAGAGLWLWERFHQ